MDDVHIGVNPGGFGGSRPPQILGRGSWEGVARGSWKNILVVKYYYILSC